MIFGMWNIQTFMDKETQTKPEKRTAVFTKELSRYNIDIVALSKTRLANKISEPKGSYTFFWKGKTQDEERIHGIGLAIKSLLLTPLPDLPTTFNEWRMKLHFPLNASWYITVTSAYSPTLTSSVRKPFIRIGTTL